VCCLICHQFYLIITVLEYLKYPGFDPNISNRLIYWTVTNVCYRRYYSSEGVVTAFVLLRFTLNPRVKLMGFVVDKLALRKFVSEDLLCLLPVIISLTIPILLPLNMAGSRHVGAPGRLIIWG
jgi:hypothetical protein